MEEVFKNDHGAEWVRIAKEKNPELIRDLMEKNGYRSTSDMPACLFWHEQLQLYPDAKVVVTLRDPESWYGSWMKTIATTVPDTVQCPVGSRVSVGLGLAPSNNIGGLFREITRRAFKDDWSKQSLINNYLGQIEDVKRRCPPKQLLLFNSADGWEPLCAFLGVPIPEEPYPHLFDTAAFQRTSTIVNVIGWIVTIRGLGFPLLFRTRSSISDPLKMSTNTKYATTDK